MAFLRVLDRASFVFYMSLASVIDNTSLISNWSSFRLGLFLFFLKITLAREATSQIAHFSTACAMPLMTEIISAIAESRRYCAAYKMLVVV